MKKIHAVYIYNILKWKISMWFIWIPGIHYFLKYLILFCNGRFDYGTGSLVSVLLSAWVDYKLAMSYILDPGYCSTGPWSQKVADIWQIFAILKINDELWHCCLLEVCFRKQGEGRSHGWLTSPYISHSRLSHSDTCDRCDRWSVGCQPIHFALALGMIWLTVSFLVPKSPI